MGKRTYHTLMNLAKDTKESDRASIGPGVWAWGLTNKDGRPNVASPNEKQVARVMQTNKLDVNQSAGEPFLWTSLISLNRNPNRYLADRDW
eukprot:8999419-Lingulodinium_polyedra.AAC.1